MRITEIKTYVLVADNADVSLTSSAQDTILVEIYTDENVLMQLDIIEELESHLTSEHDSNEWINYKELEEDNPLPYFDHKGKQITSEQYDKRYMD